MASEKEDARGKFHFSTESSPSPYLNCEKTSSERLRGNNDPGDKSTTGGKTHSVEGKGEKGEGIQAWWGETILTRHALGLPHDDKEPAGVSHPKCGTSRPGSSDFWAVSLPSVQESGDSRRVFH